MATPTPPAERRRRLVRRRRRRYAVTFDVETTGPKGRGIIFSIGLSVVECPLDGGFTSPADVVPCERIRLTLRLLSPVERAAYGPDASEYDVWADVWQRRGWHESTFTKCWGLAPNLEMLSRLSAEAQYYDDQAFAMAFDATIARLERRYRVTPPPPAEGSDMFYVFDKMHFDVVWLDHILSCLGAQSLGYYRRDSRSPASYDLESYVCGLLGLSPWLLDREVDLQPVLNELAALANTVARHDHDPANDAYHLAVQFLMAEHVCKRARVEPPPGFE
jgi:hypothetical protein